MIIGQGGQPYYHYAGKFLRWFWRENPDYHQGFASCRLPDSVVVNAKFQSVIVTAKTNGSVGFWIQGETEQSLHQLRVEPISSESKLYSTYSTQSWHTLTFDLFKDAVLKIPEYYQCLWIDAEPSGKGNMFVRQVDLLEETKLPPADLCNNQIRNSSVSAVAVQSPCTLLVYTMFNAQLESQQRAFHDPKCDKIPSPNVTRYHNIHLSTTGDEMRVTVQLCVANYQLWHEDISVLQYQPICSVKN